MLRTLDPPFWDFYNFGIVSENQEKDSIKSRSS